MASRKKVESAAMSIRFSGKQELDLHQAIGDIVEQTGKSENTVMKYLMQIGLAWYQKGSVAGIDGAVILKNNAEVSVISATNAETTGQKISNVTPPNPVQKKNNAFLD